MTRYDWPFEDDDDVIVLTTRGVVVDGNPILYVSHDSDDGMWQFHDGSDVKEEDAMIILLGEAVDIDETLKPLADLPLGWCAWRTGRNDPWHRQREEMTRG